MKSSFKFQQDTNYLNSETIILSINHDPNGGQQSYLADMNVLHFADKPSDLKNRKWLLMMQLLIAVNAPEISSSNS